MEENATNATDERFVEALKANRLEALVVDFPRPRFRGQPIKQCRVEVLTCAQIDAIRIAEAQRLIKAGVTIESAGEVMWEIVCADRVARACIAASLHSVVPIEGSGIFPRLFATGNELSSMLAHEEVERLLEHYLEAQSLAHLEEEEADGTAT